MIPCPIQAPIAPWGPQRAPSLGCSLRNPPGPWTSPCGSFSVSLGDAASRERISKQAEKAISRPTRQSRGGLALGVLPLALARTSGSEIHRPLAVVYIGGFIVAIFFEQILLPVLYEVFSRVKKERSFA
jgi:hypothetical protein